MKRTAVLLEFDKLSANGNDFILIDNRQARFDGSEHGLFRSLCQRRTGIGADGLLLIEEHASADFSMRYFNADGYEADMCGNGARASAWWARRHGLSSDDIVRFRVRDVAYQARCHGSRVSLLMHPPEMLSYTPGPAESHGVAGGYALAVGVPHYVVFDDDPDTRRIATVGASLCADKAFPRGTNVNFVSRSRTGNRVLLRTWERGVNAETLSCGTGCLATAWVLHQHFDTPFPVEITTRGGVLTVDIDPGSGRPVLTGTVQHVFHGQLDIASALAAHEDHQTECP